MLVTADLGSVVPLSPPQAVTVKQSASVTTHRFVRIVESSEGLTVDWLATRTHTHYCTAFIMSKIGRYIATTIPPTTIPRNTIMIGSNRLMSTDTAASTSSS